MEWWTGTVEWNGGLERWNGMVDWNGGMEWWTGTAEWNGGKHPLCLSVKPKVLILTYKHFAHVPKLIPWHNFNWRPKLIS